MSEALRGVACKLVQAALAAADPAAAVRRFLRFDRVGQVLWAGHRAYPLAEHARVVVVGGGKAALPMARAVEELLGERISAGLVVAKAGQLRGPMPQRIAVAEGAHPVPDRRSVQSTKRLLECLRDLEPCDLVLCLLSGGASSLLTLPAEDIALEDLEQLVNDLLGAGVPIGAINAVRKHLTRLGGGQLAALAAPASLVALILSDVVGSPLDVIASGPTAPDSTTYGEALQVLERCGLRASSTPTAILRALERGAAGERPETHRADDPLFARVQNLVIGSNELAAQAACTCAQNLGYSSLILSTFLEGEAREVGRVCAALLQELARRSRPLPRPACLVLGGETTVTLRGDGRGGRNQELALAAALGLQGLEDVLLVALATDGNDGPTDAAGALADGRTVQRGEEAGLCARAHLARNDSYPFFQALGDLLLLGPTGTNVNDLVLLLAQ